MHPVVFPAESVPGCSILWPLTTLVVCACGLEFWLTDVLRGSYQCSCGRRYCGQIGNGEVRIRLEMRSLITTN